MSRVLGIDPGTSGALAIFDNISRNLTIYDMPRWQQTVGQRKRPRIDVVELADLFELWENSIDLVVIEQIVPHRYMRGSKNTLYLQGYNVGILYMAAVQARMPLETVQANTWKRIMKVPPDDAGIVRRYFEVFPRHRDLVYGRGGGFRHDRAEAALIARYGADRMVDNIEPGTDWRLRAREAETGA